MMDISLNDTNHPYYRYHVFFCTNLRERGLSCARREYAWARNYAKARIKMLGIHGKGGIRINSAGCMNRCVEGPIIVIYPEGTWYTYSNKNDIDDIIEQHLIGGRRVDRLLIAGRPKELSA
jgi:(2Fe-2S) ferredoxin